MEATVAKKQEKPNGDPTVEKKCVWLRARYTAGPPKRSDVVEKIYKSLPHRFKVGVFLHNLVQCWTGYRGTLTQEQKRELEERCPWMKERITRRTRNQNE
jgi:hypothetical protein